MSVDAQWLSRFPVLAQFPVPRRLPQMLGAPEDVAIGVWTGSAHSSTVRWFSADCHGVSARWELWQRLLQHPLVMQRLVPQVSLHPKHGNELSLLIDGTRRLASLIPLQPAGPTGLVTGGRLPGDGHQLLDDWRADEVPSDWQRFLTAVAGSNRAHRRADRLTQWLNLQAFRMSRLH